MLSLSYALCRIACASGLHVPARHLNCILPRHPTLQYLRQLVAGLLLVPLPQAVLDEGAVSCSCAEKLSRTGRRGECRGRRGRGR